MADPINITSVDPDILIQMLQKMGMQGDVENMLVSDVKSGFTLDEKGNFNLVEYIAWLIINSGRG